MWPFGKSSHQAQITYSPTLNSAQPSAPVTSPALAQARPAQMLMERPTAPQPVDIKAENIKSIISQGEWFEGTLRLQKGIKIDGRVTGNIQFGITDGMLVVNDQARVDGDIYGPRAIIVGEVFGNINISGRLIILPSARIHGDIAAGALQLHEGACIDGRICTCSELQQKTHEHQSEVSNSPTAPATSVEAPAEVLRFAVGSGQGR
ncbi:MAG: polymer-forming cytoskeletal protein [Proteobacteria bacterium]|nr:polymer-forming cytoskeletal protein [Pseudomonadota bacterium]